jgi:6-phosphogluconolactonase
MARLSERPNDVRVFDDTLHLIAATADEIVSISRAAVDARGRFVWALAGGSTPRDVYRLLAGDAYRERMPWNAIHFFWGDERHVPPDDPDSNFRMAREAMLDAVPVPEENIHRVMAEEPDAQRAAAEYESTLRSFFALAPGQWPVFDLIQLGLGKEGHTASLFPGGAAIRERERLVVAPWVEAQSTFRVTFTPPVLNHARRTLFLVSGEEKAEALHAVLEGAREPEVYPAQIVEGNCLWMVDRPAASLLKKAA